MLSPSEGKEIYERILAQHEAGHAITPEDATALMQAAESGYAPAQRAYANVINNVEGNMLAAVPWYCKAVQQGDEEALEILRELYATEPLVCGQVGRYLSAEHIITLRRRRSGGRNTNLSDHGVELRRPRREKPLEYSESTPDSPTMLSPSEGKEIYERIMSRHEAGHAMTPADASALMQAAESGYAPAQRAYANVINNVEGNMLAAVPWYCKAVQQGDEEALEILSELYATEPLVCGQVGRYLSAEHIIALRRRRSGGRNTNLSTPCGELRWPWLDKCLVYSNNVKLTHSILPALGLAGGLAAGYFFIEGNNMLRFLLLLAGFLLAAFVEWLYFHFWRYR